MKKHLWNPALAATALLLGTVLLAGTTRRDVPPAPARPTHPSPTPPLRADGIQTTLRFSTYLGGSDIEVSSAIALDDEGAVYLAGQTLSGDFPAKNAAHGYQGGLVLGADVFVAKYSPGGDALRYATFLGGSLGEEIATALAVDDEGRAYVAGSTMSPDFPVRNTLHGYRGGDQLMTDAFIARLSADGTEIDFATYLGGTGDETITALALDEDGNVYVTGTTTSTDFPTTAGAFQPARGGEADQARLDVFVARLTPDGAGFDLAVATYLGGSWDEIPASIAVDGEGRMWVAGLTTSDDFPTQDALQATYAGPIRDLEGDVFAARLSADGARLDFSTYLGGSQGDAATGLALDADGAVYLTGWTRSNTFPTTPGAYQTDRQSLQDRFAARLMPMGAGWMLDYATRLGAPGGFETGRAGLAVDQAGRVWIAGATASDQFPSREAEQAFYGGGESDGFLARLDASGATLGYATFLGGSSADVVTGVALGDDTVCVTGSTGSPDFPTQAALQPAFDGPTTAGLTVTSVFVTCFETLNEASVMTRLAVAPDSVGLIAGETRQFEAQGFDQFEQPLAVRPVWNATGGAIDSTGRYTAGDDAGLFTATATDTASGLSATAVVNIYSGVAAEEAADLPAEFALYGNYPNPFNPQTTIRFDVKEPTRVTLTLYDVLGRKQATLVERDYAPGRYEVRFDGRGWPSGTYFYAVEMGDFRSVKKMLLIR